MSNNSLTKEKEKKSKRGYIISLTLVLLLTAGALLFNFFSAGAEILEDGYTMFDAIAAGAQSIWAGLSECSPGWLICIAAIVVASYLVDGLVLMVFARLYTRRYYFHQGLANSMVGAFYNNVTPGASGGQFMQAYLLKKQGIEVSNAASIMVMWFIIYQSALIFLDIIALCLMGGELMSLPGIDFLPGETTWFGWDGTVTIVPLIIFGFALNVGVILILFLMSFSHRFHNFILHHIIGFLGKIRILKNPDRTRENLRVQVENFKIELRRLSGNVPVTILIFVLMTIMLMLRFSVPYFAGLALDAYGGAGYDFVTMFNAIFRSAFHQMVTGLLPIPGSAGVSELFFNSVFGDFFFATTSILSSGESIVIRSATDNMMTAQLIWRIATFYLIFIISGFVAAFYRSRGGEHPRVYPSRQTFVDLQMDTFEDRKRSVDTLYETRQLSKKAIRSRLKEERYLPEGFVTGDDAMIYENIHRLPETRKSPANPGSNVQKRTKSAPKKASTTTKKVKK